jgi:hypothetical protein
LKILVAPVALKKICAHRQHFRKSFAKPLPTSKVLAAPPAQPPKPSQAHFRPPPLA